MSDFLTGNRIHIPILCNSLHLVRAEMCWEKLWLTICLNPGPLCPCSAVQFVGDDTDNALGKLYSNRSYVF
ncbi:hypothetical protein TNCV_4198401 [Trichonephila clavipes]|nr:hypothetical protein TNCV_4198401 [Trichonephila clavipes]